MLLTLVFSLCLLFLPFVSSYLPLLFSCPPSIFCFLSKVLFTANPFQSNIVLIVTLSRNCKTKMKPDQYWIFETDVFENWVWLLFLNYDQAIQYILRRTFYSQCSLVENLGMTLFQNYLKHFIGISVMQCCYISTDINANIAKAAIADILCKMSVNCAVSSYSHVSTFAACTNGCEYLKMSLLSQGLLTFLFPVTRQFPSC